MDWENHRWLRFRTSMGAAKTYLAQFSGGYTSPEAPDVPYETLILASDGTPAHRYPLPPADRSRVRDLAEDIAQLGNDIAAAASLDDDLPKPPPKLVLRPSLET